MDLPMQPNQSKFTSALCHVGIGMLLSFAGCMAGAADEEPVEPGQTSSELGIGPGPAITPTGTAGAAAIILPPTAGHPAVGPTTASCTTDADCRVERDNCSECACQALGASQAMSGCYGEKVTCVLDPCAQVVARCIAGHC